MRLKALLAAVVLTLCLSTTGASASRVGAVFDREADCSALPPAAHSVAGITDDGHLVVIVATVLLDGIKKERASALFERANTAYEPINLRLVPTFRRVTFLPDQPATGSRRATIDTANLFAQAKDAVGGTRPEGSDLVHVLTNKDLTQGAYGNTVAGVAECAGGIQWPDKAFSASEDGPDEYSIGPPGIVRVREVPAKTIAHEIGHVLGALHEYKSCAEGVETQDATRAEASPCTIMSDVADLASLRFGAMEAAIVRGYALAYADFPRP